MTRALRDFDTVYERAVQRIDINDLVQMVDMLAWDELGVRMFERAIVLVGPQLRDSGVQIVRTSDERPDRGDEAAGARRENLTSAENLSSQPFLKNWSRPWFWWEKQIQKPDGLFSIQLRAGSMEEELLVCCECDAHGKEDEIRKVALKMWQAVDAARWDRYGVQRRSELSCYTIRSNLVKIRKYHRIADPIQRALAGLYRLMRSNIYAVLLMIDDWLASIGKHDKDAYKDTKDCRGLPRQRGRVYDHHIFVGCFTLPPERDCNLPSIQVYKDNNFNDVRGVGNDKGFAVTANEYATYMQVGKDDKHISDLKNRPLPLIIDERNTSLAPYKRVVTLSKQLRKRWGAGMRVRHFADVECSSISFQRADWRNILAWLEFYKKGNRKTDKTEHRNLLHGLWYITDLREILSRVAYLGDPDITENLTGDKNVHNLLKQQVSEAQQVGDQNAKEYFNNPEQWHIVYFIHNVMAQMEQVLLSTLRIEGGFPYDTGATSQGKFSILRWDLNHHTRDTESFKDSLLMQVKKLLRDNPAQLRQRSTQKIESWEAYNKSGGTLRSRCYAALERDLPQLDEHMQAYLKQFQVPQASLFSRLIRCNSILALRELARQVDAKRMDEPVARHLATLDVCVQSEVNFIFDRVRENLDVFVDTSTVRSVADKDDVDPGKHVKHSPAHAKINLLLQAAQTMFPKTNPEELLLHVGKALNRPIAMDQDILKKLTGILFQYQNDPDWTSSAGYVRRSRRRRSGVRSAAASRNSGDSEGHTDSSSQSSSARSHDTEDIQLSESDSDSDSS